MRRTKRCPNRRRQALFWSAVVLVLLALLRLTTGYYALLPVQALRALEEDHGCGRTEVVRRSVDWRGGEVEYLAVNDRVLVFAAAKPGWLGWELSGRDVVDCTEETALCGAGSRSRALGRVEDGRIVRVEHAFWFVPLDEAHREGEPELHVYATAPEDWYTWEGERCFFLEHASPGYGYYQGGTLRGYDAAGRVVTECPAS